MSDLKIDSSVLPLATSDAPGAINLGYTENDRNYPLEVDSNNKAFVNVPWKDLVTLSVTYAELKNLRDTSLLIPGKQYRIIDYEATTTQEGTRALNEQLFDIIVTADDIDKINPNARAAIGTRQSSSFESLQRYEDWELKYDIDNGLGALEVGVGICRYWGDPYGKGLIYYLKDEYGNTCGFDFKNIVIDAYYALGLSEASETLNSAVTSYNANILSTTIEESYSYIFPYPPDFDPLYDYTIVPLCIRNAKISNYTPYDERSTGECLYEYIPYVIICPNYIVTPRLNLNIENSNRIFITHETSGTYDAIIEENLFEVNINIKNSIDIILCDVYSKNVNIINSGYGDGVCIMGEIYNNVYNFGGFQGQQLLLNNVGTCLMEIGFMISGLEYRSKLIIKINNCQQCIFKNCEPTNNFICDNVLDIIYLNMSTNNYYNIIIKNSYLYPLHIISNLWGITSNDENEFEYIFTNKEGSIVSCNTGNMFNS